MFYDINILLCCIVLLLLLLLSYISHTPVYYVYNTTRLHSCVCIYIYIISCNDTNAYTIWSLVVGDIKCAI